MNSSQSCRFEDGCQSLCLRDVFGYGLFCRYVFSGCMSNETVVSGTLDLGRDCLKKLGNVLAICGCCDIHIMK